jgi:SAM-dependent methyltransferase
MHQFSDRACQAFDLIEKSAMKQWVGDGAPATTGRTALNLLEQVGGLEATDTVLDFGCGVGRVSIATADALTSGKLYGVDIVPDMIDFCRSSITPIFPNTTFYCSDASNINYNKLKKGSGISEEEIFRAICNQIDLAFAFSVFTHLSPDETARSFRLLSGALKDDGTLLITAFLLDRMSRSFLSLDKASFQFSERPKDSELFYNPDKVQGFCAFDLQFLTRLAEEAGFYVVAIVHGTWRGLPLGRGFSSFQDVIVMRKQTALPADFDAARYVELNPDLKNSRISPVCHYTVHGRREKRRYK